MDERDTRKSDTSQAACHGHGGWRICRGFTLVELLIALLLVDVALLGLVGTSAIIVRQLGGAKARAAAVSLARSHLERLASTRCDGDASGEPVPAPGMREWWRVTVATASTRVLADSVEFMTHRGTRSVVLRSRSAC